MKRWFWAGVGCLGCRVTGESDYGHRCCWRRRHHPCNGWGICIRPTLGVSTRSGAIIWAAGNDCWKQDGHRDLIYSVVAYVEFHCWDPQRLQQGSGMPTSSTEIVDMRQRKGRMKEYMKGDLLCCLDVISLTLDDECIRPLCTWRWTPVHRCNIIVNVRHHPLTVVWRAQSP